MEKNTETRGDDESDGSKFPLLRADFVRHLSISTNEEFLLLSYAVYQLQQGNIPAAQLILTEGFPDHLASAKIGDSGAIHGWEIETIVNELFTASTSYQYVYSTHPRLNAKSAVAFSHVVNLLRELENEEFSYYDQNIRYELRRIMCRQFEWQRGFYNKALAYRSSMMFDGPECRKLLLEKIGLTLDDISYGAFALYAAFQNFAQVDRNLPTDHIGLPHDVRDRVIKLFSADLYTVRHKARRDRAAHRSTAYRPSVLRTYPCVRRSDNEDLLLCPLPELIMARASTGIFYDVISGGGSVRNEVGRGFESYCVRLFQKSFPECEVSPEFFYGSRSRRMLSPDVLVSQNDSIMQIYECKAVHMSVDDKYAEEEFVGRGYDEIAKAILQIWRFVSHTRKGRTGRQISKDCIGTVILLDSWMTMVLDARARVFAAAESLANDEASIEPEDRIPILFSEVGDIENVVMKLDFANFQQLLSVSLQDNFEGWLLHSVLASEKILTTERAFPFDDLNEVVPWWGRVSRMTRED